MTRTAAAGGASTPQEPPQTSRPAGAQLGPQWLIRYTPGFCDSYAGPHSEPTAPVPTTATSLTR